LISINDVSISEGNILSRTVFFELNLSAASAKGIMLNYATADGTAVGNEDYHPINGILIFSPGQTTAFIEVEVNSDTLSEDDETFTVNLTFPVNATIADGTAIGTIVN